MEYFAKICIACMVILIAFFCVYLFLKIKKKTETKTLLNQKNRTEDLPYKLLKINFKKRRIMRHIYLPYTSEPDSRLFYVDLLVINHGGILLITVKHFRGSIENPFRGDWRQFYNNNITQFCNPFEESGVYARALGNIFKQDNMANIPIRSAICYLDGKTRFKNRIEQLLVADKLVPYIKDMGKNRFLSGMEINNVAYAIRINRRSQKNNNVKPKIIQQDKSGR